MSGTIGLDYPAPPQVAIQPFKIKRQPISHQLNKIDFIVKLINKFIQTKSNTLRFDNRFKNLGDLILEIYPLVA